MRLLLAAFSLTLSASTINFDGLAFGEPIVNQYAAQGAVFNSSYSEAKAVNGRLRQIPRVLESEPFDPFLTVFLDHAYDARTISFDLFMLCRENALVVQSYQQIPGQLSVLLDEFIISDPAIKTIQLANGTPTFFVVIDAFTRGFEMDNLRFGDFQSPTPMPAVPEPRHLVAVGLALAGLVWIGRRT